VIEPAPTLETALGIGSRRADQALTDAVDRAVGRLLADGAIRDVLRRYGAIPEP
jgi:ABC-type amino acid transport substrate-binding protein